MSIVILSLLLLLPVQQPGPAVPYQPPVAAPIVDPFRPPSNPYGPGNRGLEYATVPGTPIGAVADGVVVFAGPVAGALHVTVLHADGIRTSYSFLATILVAAGQRVARGQAVGLSGSRFHLGARTGPRAYLDPASLWAGPLHVHLVPVDGSGDDAASGGAGTDDRPDLASTSGQDPPIAALAGGQAVLATTSGGATPGGLR